jgi:hypothetical protein
MKGCRIRSPLSYEGWLTSFAHQLPTSIANLNYKTMSDFFFRFLVITRRAGPVTVMIRFS